MRKEGGAEPAGAFEEGSARLPAGGGLISLNQGGASFLHPPPQAWREGREAGGQEAAPPQLRTWPLSLLPSCLGFQGGSPITHLRG